MRPPGTLLQVDGQPWLAVEAGYNDESRAIILLVRPDDVRFRREGQAPVLRWGEQGHWQPVARWTAEGLVVGESRDESQRPAIEAALAEYRRRPRPERPVRAWAARGEQGFAARLEQALPMGVAAVCHEREQDAAAAEGARQAVPIENLAMFLTHLVREGYAGAMWNGTRPVFFCVDEAGELRFLRVGPDARAGGVALELLDESDRWQPYDGEDTIEFLDNREACDARLVATVGSLPVVDWPQGGAFWSLGAPDGTPGVLTEGEGQAAVRQGVVFTSEAAARAYGEDVAPALSVFRVEDLLAFLTHEEMAGCAAALNPGGHRARGGLLWSDGERVVLDSFSGFWRLGEAGFEAVADDAADGPSPT